MGCGLKGFVLSVEDIAETLVAALGTSDKCFLKLILFT